MKKHDMHQVKMGEYTLEELKEFARQGRLYMIVDSDSPDYKE